jgi:hypothetical protein
MASDNRYSVHFEDGRRVTTNYVGDVLQVVTSSRSKARIG